MRKFSVNLGINIRPIPVKIYINSVSSFYQQLSIIWWAFPLLSFYHNKEPTWLQYSRIIRQDRSNRFDSTVISKQGTLFFKKKPARRITDERISSRKWRSHRTSFSSSPPPRLLYQHQDQPPTMRLTSTPTCWRSLKKLRLCLLMLTCLTWKNVNFQPKRDAMLPAIEVSLDCDVSVPCFLLVPKKPVMLPRMFWRGLVGKSAAAECAMLFLRLSV